MQNHYEEVQREAFEAQLTSREALLDVLRELSAEIDGFAAEAGDARMTQPGVFGDLSLKDVITHLTGWRLVTASRLEAPLLHAEPVFPWPAELDEDHHTDEINQWFYETNRDKSVAEVMRDSRDTFDRCARAIAALPEEDLFQAGRFPWLGEYMLGPAVVSGTYFHFHEDHEGEIRAWLAKD